MIRDEVFSGTRFCGKQMKQELMQFQLFVYVRKAIVTIAS